MNIGKIARIAVDGSYIMYNSIEDAANDSLLNKKEIELAIRFRLKYDDSYWVCKNTYKRFFTYGPDIAKKMDYIFWDEPSSLKPIQKSKLLNLFNTRNNEHTQKWYELISTITDIDIIELLNYRYFSSTDLACNRIRVYLHNLPEFIADTYGYEMTKYRHSTIRHKYVYLNSDFYKEILMREGYVNRVVIFNSIIEASYFTLIPISEIKNSKDFRAL